MKIKGYKKITGKIECVSGLHIGGSADQIEIGGVDLPIIKHPISGEPYIPGSSLKGKMRSQLEKRLGKVSVKGAPCGCGLSDCLVCKTFGAHQNTKHNLGATRLLVRDATLTEDKRAEYKKILEEKGASYLEKKTENIVNRKTGTAEHPRSQERVPAGAEFGIELVVQLYDTDNESEIIEFVKRGLKEIEDTYLGGYGSRGSGQVRFKDLKLDGAEINL